MTRSPACPRMPPVDPYDERPTQPRLLMPRDSFYGDWSGFASDDLDEADE